MLTNREICVNTEIDRAARSLPYSPPGWDR